ncbi:hypothetical protein JTE90_000249 [Oedothorax gibbosus]|uniref:Uncharacterized protein n=1 Tax=Oedothorax gibbosus TaxID=931172 RepID=A0AAV6VRR5_9ARAC|nr:hypothetical protein JTE90_000249 [Oedothorax gibbosus]
MSNDRSTLGYGFGEKHLAGPLVARQNVSNSQCFVPSPLEKTGKKLNPGEERKNGNLLDAEATNGLNDVTSPKLMGTRLSWNGYPAILEIVERDTQFY